MKRNLALILLLLGTQVLFGQKKKSLPLSVSGIDQKNIRGWLEGADSVYTISKANFSQKIEIKYRNFNSSFEFVTVNFRKGWLMQKVNVGGLYVTGRDLNEFEFENISSSFPFVLL